MSQAPKFTKRDALIIAIIMVAFLCAGTIQFHFILGMPFSHKIFVMPIVMSVVFSFVITKTRYLQRALNEESEALKSAQATVLALNVELNERLDARTQLLKDVQNQLSVAQQRASISALSAGVIHDLNNALMVISAAWSDLEELEERRHAGVSPSELFKIKEEVSALHQELNAGLEQALSFTKGFQTLVRPQQSQNSQAPIRELLQRLIPFLRRSFEGKRALTYRWESEESCCVPMSVAQLTQVVMNLIVNARDALKPEGGEVIVSGRCLEHNGRPSFALSVSDNGHGMSPEVQAHIFEPFFTTKAEGEGTGLGLHVISSAIEGAGGEVKVYSTEGVGTRFVVYLPQVLTNPCQPLSSPQEM
jgi:two-component system, NtrC family, sensor kinase